MPINQLAPGYDSNELERHYAGMPDDALLNLRLEGGLTPEADAALQAEMSKRSLGSQDVAEMKQWVEEHKEVPKPPPPQRLFLGYGIRYVGKKFLTSEDERKGVFVATRFIVLRQMSIIPLGSYRVETGGAGLPSIESRVSMQWDQVWQGVWPVLLATAIGLGGFALMIATSKRR